MLIHSLYHQSASMESVCDDWDRMVHFSRHNPRQVVYRYYKDKDQIHLDLSMVRLGDIGGLMLAAKMRASLPRELHPAVHWSHLQQLIVSRIQELNWRPLVSWRWLMHYNVHITKTLPRLSRLEASDNRIGSGRPECKSCARRSRPFPLNLARTNGSAMMSIRSDHT